MAYIHGINNNSFVGSAVSYFLRRGIYYCDSKKSKIEEDLDLEPSKLRKNI